MNKDTPILRFGNTFQMGIPTGISIKEVYSNVIPLPFSTDRITDIKEWLKGRLVLSHRRDILKQLEFIGLVKIDDIISVTNCISLNDTFWVKPVDSKLTWNRVSPYRNPLNSAIADYAIGSGRSFNGKKISSSPDFSTGGSFPKCWKRVNGVIYLYKTGSSGFSNTGMEPYSEIYAVKLMEKLGITHVNYELVKYKGRLATRCPCMCNESVGLYQVGDLTIIREGYEDLVRQGFVSAEYLSELLLVDFLSLNTDRHLGNIGVLVDNDSQVLQGGSPIYDNNLSFVPYFVPDTTKKLSQSLEEYIIGVDSDGNTLRASDGSTFEDIFRLSLKLGGGNIVSKVRKLKGFRFNIGMPRDRVANAVLERQLLIAKRILNSYKR